MKLTFFRTTQDEISKSQQRGQACNLYLAACALYLKAKTKVCEINNYITNQIKEELHAKTLTNLGTEEKEFKARFDLLNAVKRGESVCVNAKLNN